MPVTVNPFPHSANAVQETKFPNDAHELLLQSNQEEFFKCKSIIQSSFPTISKDSPIFSSDNGFVKAAILAYNDHHHLIIRPEDVWFAILTQLSFYINAHAEELRSFFVSHEGQKELEIEIGATGKLDMGEAAMQMTDLMGKHVNDPKLRTWIMPDFSTTTDVDKVVAAILMMGSMQAYFTYHFAFPRCGIPSVTLLGTKDDWLSIQQRLEMLPQLGAEANQFYKLLKPVLKYMVLSFDRPKDSSVVQFWQTICHERPLVRGGCGPFSKRSTPPYISGWITAFCFWDQDGKSLYSKPNGFVDFKGGKLNNPGCRLDGTVYHRLSISSIPRGSAAVPVTLVDLARREYPTRMVAGSVGIQAQDRGQGISRAAETNGTLGVHFAPVLDTIQPVSGWWMFFTMEAPCSNLVPEKAKDATKEPIKNEKISPEPALIDETELSSKLESVAIDLKEERPLNMEQRLVNITA
jgi:Domain of unknown function (DUF4419)